MEDNKYNGTLTHEERVAFKNAFLKIVGCVIDAQINSISAFGDSGKVDVIKIISDMQKKNFEMLSAVDDLVFLLGVADGDQ